MDTDSMYIQTPGLEKREDKVKYVQETFNIDIHPTKLGS